MENVSTLSASQEEPTSLPKSGTIMEQMPIMSQPNIDYNAKEKPTMPLPNTTTSMKEKCTPSTSSVAKEKPTSRPSTGTTDIMEMRPTLTNLTHLETKDKKRVLLITLIPGVKTLRESYRKGKEMLRKKSRNLLFM